MKRTISIFLIFGMLLSLFSFAVADGGTEANFELEARDPNGKVYEYYEQLFESNGKLYLFGSHLAELDLTGRSHKRLAATDYEAMEHSIQSMFDYEGTLAGLSAQEKTVFKIEIADGTIKAGEMLSKINFDSDIFWNSGNSAVAEDGVLYIVNPNYTNDGGEKYVLLAHNIRTGETKAFDNASYRQVASYKDGKLLAYIMENVDEMSNRGTVKIGTLDKASGAFEALFSVEDSHSDVSVFYHKASDSICYFKEGVIYRVHSKTEAKPCAYLPVRYQTPAIIELADGRIASLRKEINSSVLVRDLDENKLPSRTLTIIGDHLHGGAFVRAEKIMNDVPIITKSTEWHSGAERAAGIISAGDSFDIIQLSSGFTDVEALIAKGYVAPIESEIIKKYVEGMHPALKEGLIKDGVLYGLPFDMTASAAMYDEQSFAKLGLAVPRTYEELLDLVYEFKKTDNAHEESYALIDAYVLNSLDGIVARYIKDRIANGKEIVFDTEAFRNLITKALRNKKEIKNPETLFDGEEGMEQEDKPLLIMMDEFVTLENLTHGYRDREEAVTMKPLKLSVDKDGVSYVEIGAQYFLINPRSKNVDLAVRFLEEYVQTSDFVDTAGMLSGFSDEIINPEFENQKQNILDQVELAKKKIAEAKGAEKTTLEENYKYFLENYEKNIEALRYRVSRQAAELYKELLSQKQVLSSFAINSLISEEVITIDMYERFEAGQISADELIRELDNKVKLMINERK